MAGLVQCQLGAVAEGPPGGGEEFLGATAPFVGRSGRDEQRRTVETGDDVLEVVPCGEPGEDELGLDAGVVRVGWTARTR